MESRHVIKLELRSRQRNADDEAPAQAAADDEAAAAGADSSALGQAAADTRADAAPPEHPDEVVLALLDHREIDELLLCEARRTSDLLLKASAALHAASSVVLDAVAALRDEREHR